MLNRKLKFLFIAAAVLSTAAGYFIAAGQARGADDNRPVIVVRGGAYPSMGQWKMPGYALPVKAITP